MISIRNDALIISTSELHRRASKIRSDGSEGDYIETTLNLPISVIRGSINSTSNQGTIGPKIHIARTN